MMRPHISQHGAGPGSLAPSCGRQIEWRRLIAKWFAVSLAVFASLIGAAQNGRAFEDGGRTQVSTAPPPAAHEATHHPREKTYFKRKWGVEVMYVQQTAAGRMLEFRYKVLDAEKAKPLFERRTKPVLIDTETGAKLTVPVPPTTGALRNSNPPIAGRVYWMFFSNPGKLIKPGRHVSIEIGEFRVNDLIVK